MKKYIETGEYNKVTEILSKKDANSDGRKQIEESISSKIDELLSLFKEGKINCTDSDSQIDGMKSIPVSDEIIEKADSVKQKIHDLSESQDKYRKGIEYESQNDLDRAIILFSDVIKDDVNYTDAQKHMRKDKKTLVTQYVRSAKKYFRKKDLEKGTY